VKFRRQHVIGDFVVDFYAPALRLAIEVDGGGHTEVSQVEYDRRRTAVLEGQGILVLRFWNHDVLVNEDLVIKEIHRTLVQRLNGAPSRLEFESSTHAVCTWL
jgi:very-short-patch-repair endonuclease